MNDLERCPLCNNNAVLLNTSLYDGARKKDVYYVKCTMCGLSMPIRNGCISADAARNRWNTRYDREGRRIV